MDKLETFNEVYAETVRKGRQKIDVAEVINKPYQNEFEVSAITGRAVSTLRNERFLRRGLPYLVIGKRSIRYKTEDVLSYMEKCRIAFDEAAIENKK
jgi:hypothetical protein